MCFKDSQFVQLSMCPHGALHLRLGNTMLVLTNQQAQVLYNELNQYMLHVQNDSDTNTPPASHPHPQIHDRRNLN